MIIATAIFLMLLSLTLAFLEIEIEGNTGWAEHLPTWYRKSRVFTFFNGDKPLTGYHLFLLAFLLLMFHIGFFAGLPWSLPAELEVLSYYMILLTAEDFLWFAFNPHFGLKNFKKDRIWWHHGNRWFFGLFPLSYAVSVIVTIFMNYISSAIANDLNIFFSYLYVLGILAVLVIMASLLLPSVYGKWHREMRKKDDRNEFDIFH